MSFTNIDSRGIMKSNALISVLFLLMLVLVSGCTKEKPQPVSEAPPPPPPSAPAQYSLEIIPSAPARNAVLYLNAAGFDPEGARIEWLVNEMPFPSPQPLQFDASVTRKGHTVQARATVGEQVLLSPAVTIKNSPPELSRVKIMPEVFRAGDTLSIEAHAADLDDDPVTIVYEWTKNGQPAGGEARISAAVQRGDQIIVKITPFDGELYGAPITLKRQVGNLPPQIIDERQFVFDGRRFSKQVRAADPDGDPLTFSIKSGPAGLSIDPASGLVEWDVPPEFAGKAQFEVSVADGNGGQGSQGFNLTIK